MQIDGLSRAILERALKSGYMPFLRRLLRRQGYLLEPMTVGLPTSTAAFQMAMMYGVRPDIPGFHYYDRETRADIHFPRPGHAASVETRQSAGRPGILRGGSAYGCVFAGGADNNLFNFSNLTRPSGRGLLAALSPFVVLVWVCLKSLARTLYELFRNAPHLIGGAAKSRQSRRWLMIKIGLSIWMRGFFTMAACRDLYAGVPAVYVNYLDYDEAAHHFGPNSRQALVNLRRVDRAIRQLWRVARRVPEHRYDVYILADHGQAPCRPFSKISGGRPFEQWIFERFLERPAPPVGRPASGLARGIRARSREVPGLFQRFLHYLNEDFLRHSDPEAHEQDGVRVISAGPNALFYVLDADRPLDAGALERRFPGLAQALSLTSGVGLVLARSADGPVCFWRGGPYRLGKSDLGPFAARPDASLVVEAIAELMKMPNAGDYVIYGTDAPEGHISFMPEAGGHAGPTHDEMHTFIIHSPQVILPSPITHPTQLYEHFIRYQQPP